MSFTDFGLNKLCIDALEQAGYKKPTELQAQLIPLVNEKKNVLVKNHSASGKTGAFLIPAINYILNNPVEEYNGTRILVLTSRKDRVNQIKYTIKRIGDQAFRFGFIVSGRPYQPQMRLLRRPLDMLIATPGRLNDLAENGKADFSNLEMLIVDDLSSVYHKEFQGLVDRILAEKK
ncbi:MAG TPA: DEAD/DEAH box helicase, partial [Thiothrix sp.]|nr:DEAD/DEAH box helicase [Thiothrix sp.]